MMHVFGNYTLREKCSRESSRERERIANGARHHKMCRDNKKIINNSLFSIIQSLYYGCKRSLLSLYLSYLSKVIVIVHLPIERNQVSVSFCSIRLKVWICLYKKQFGLERKVDNTDSGFINKLPVVNHSKII